MDYQITKLEQFVSVKGTPGHTKSRQRPPLRIPLESYNWSNQQDSLHGINWYCFLQVSFYLKECGASQILQTPIMCLYLHVFVIHILWGNDLESQYRKRKFESWVFDRKLQLKVYSWNRTNWKSTDLKSFRIKKLQHNIAVIYKFY